MIAAPISQGVQLSSTDSTLVVLGFVAVMITVVIGICELHERRLRRLS